MKVEHLSPSPSFPGRRFGFTLLELIVAFTILALFILPILEIVAASRVRAIKYTHDRVVRDLAQRKLFERIYYIETMDSGTFENEGYPTWRWEFLPWQIMSQGEQVLLQYTIRVITPKMERASSQSAFDSVQGAFDSAQGAFDSAQGAFEMSAWTFPSPEWFDEYQALEEQGFFDLGYPGGFQSPGGVPGMDW